MIYPFPFVGKKATNDSLEETQCIASLPSFPSPIIVNNRGKRFSHWKIKHLKPQAVSFYKLDYNYYDLNQTTLLKQFETIL